MPTTIYFSVYVDDIQNIFKYRNLSICEGQVRLGGKNLAVWVEKKGFKLNPGKRTCVVFSRKRGIHTHPEVTLNHVLIPAKKEHTFLVVVFDEDHIYSTH